MFGSMKSFGNFGDGCLVGIGSIRPTPAIRASKRMYRAQRYEYVSKSSGGHAAKTRVACSQNEYAFVELVNVPIV